jgi:hypothetical protein
MCKDTEEGLMNESGQVVNQEQTSTSGLGNLPYQPTLRERLVKDRVHHMNRVMEIDSILLKLTPEVETSMQVYDKLRELGYITRY